ncbi:MAG TPA: DUF5320 domain-containing protein [Nitrospira sp.]|nr:DUF5320 domain-containing protein [Nitrospira sp.]
MNTHSPRKRTAALPLILAGLLFCSGCGAFSDQTLVVDSAVGAVYLQQLSNRGATVRYSGPLKSFKASHPATLDPDILAKIFTGLHVGIISADNQGDPRGIKPTPVFSFREVAFLSPAVAGALKRAHPDQRVKFQVGSGNDVTDGTLYVDGPVMHIAFTHYHAPAERPDEQLSIYALSFEPSDFQVPSATPQTWMEIERDQPRVSLAYELLAKLPSVLPPAPPSPDPAIAIPGSAAGPAPQAAETTPDMKAAVDKQAQELEALRAELEALKKQLQEQQSASQPGARPKNAR